MPKTKNGIILRGFDEQNIFYYLFFRHKLRLLHEDISDAEILDLADARHVAHLGSAKMVERLADLREYKTAVENFRKELDVRVSQLENLCIKYAQKFTETSAQTWQEKYVKAKNLKQAYADVISKLYILKEKIDEIERDGEKAIDKQRRKEFAERLQDVRQKAGLKQSDLAAKVGIAPTTVANYEQGRSDPQIPMLIRICNALSCSANELLGLKC